MAKHFHLDDDDDDDDERRQEGSKDEGLGLPEGDKIGKLYFKSRTVIVAGPITDKLAQRTVRICWPWPRTATSRSTC